MRPELNKFMIRSNTRELQKTKKNKSGRSQFTRAKLQEQYQPKLRSFKPRIFSLNHINDDQKHENKIREQFQICTKAINKLKQGYTIKIDWNTKTNFRTTKGLFPTLKTQPLEIHSRIHRSTPKVTNRQMISQKQENLSKLLFKRHKKKYMLSRREQKEQSRLFGEQSYRVKTSPYDILHQKGSNYGNVKQMKKMQTPRKQKTMIEVQEQILNNTKLKVLKEELKSKFHELRHSFGLKKKTKKYLLQSLTEEDIHQFHNS